jgi:EAL domain-containing protein (putative c-di-GMP-specific phosphodiesterase class I)/CHASE2 domain-containing sensor protein
VATKTQTEAKPWKLLLWTAVAGLVFGLIGFGEIAEDWLRMARNRFHQHNASGQIVVLLIDDKSLQQVGNWPWPRRVEAALVDKLSAAGAKGTFFDINFSFPADRVGDQQFAEAIRRAGNVTLLTRVQPGQSGALPATSQLPLPIFAQHAKLATARVKYNYEGAVLRVLYSVKWSNGVIPSFASAMAGVHGTPDTEFPIDYSARLASLPTYSAGDVLAGRVDPSRLAGRNVIVGIGSDVIGDAYFIPGHGKSFGVFVHALAAETLTSGKPIDFGWFWAFLFGMCAAAGLVSRRRFFERATVFIVSAGTLLVAPAALEAQGVFVDITPALFVILVVTSVLAWRRYRASGMVNTVSHLPNLNALRLDRAGRNQALVAARILNYEEVVASLPTDKERQLVDQIAARLNVGSKGRALYHGDGGIFAWFEPTTTPVGNQLEALHALFRTPARVSGFSADLSVSFGVETGSGRSLSNRLASALVAAEQAAHDGLKWKVHDPESLENASWKLSMLSQLDEAIDRGEVWVAYQPKLDVQTRRITGAEALARWTHPEKGPIAAAEFVAAAEQHDRIGKLTDFVLERSIKAAAAIRRDDPDFNMAVNLSARLLNDRGFPLRLSAMLARHGLPASNLTLELTETATLANTGEGIDMMSRLRDLGVMIAIDDYGTGQSTLEYLKVIPADEIKIDQSFVKGIIDNRSDRLMVQSTIGLAHSLGRKVVAEGVEHRDILDVLIELGCDTAQGFAIGRPMSVESLMKRVSSSARRSAA